MPHWGIEIGKSTNLETCKSQFSYSDFTHEDVQRNEILVAGKCLILPPAANSAFLHIPYVDKFRAKKSVNKCEKYVWEKMLKLLEKN